MSSLDSKKRALSLVGSSDGRPEDDFYPTPPNVTEALLARESFDGLIWEPAAGDGAICKVLEAHKLPFIASDLNNHGYTSESIDFLEQNKKVANIITNPPFKLAQQFTEHALSLTTNKVAMFGKLNFLEGSKRKRMFQSTPLKTVYVFSSRVKLTRNGVPMKNGGMIAFAWYVWDHKYQGKPTLEWI